MTITIADALAAIRRQAKWSQARLANVLGVSYTSLNRWERGASTPSPAQAQHIRALYEQIIHQQQKPAFREAEVGQFTAQGVRQRIEALPLFAPLLPHIALHHEPMPPIYERLIAEGRLSASSMRIGALLTRHTDTAPTANTPPVAGMSAGKNTYTYDAHTYHTKVPPQGIAELLKHYLPEGGLVLDAFAGSGMTGVACRVLGHDCILNELSPAACFIADRFTDTIEPSLFASGVATVLEHLEPLRRQLYTTTCRECGKETELLYAVWSYRVLCPHCSHDFQLWDVCRSYGERVRDHKILSSFPCPCCGRPLEKSRLSRTIAEPVQVGYKCCGSRQQEVVHSPNARDLECILTYDTAPLAAGFYPQFMLPDGVNLRQPKKHGLNSIAQFYTPRNLSAMSHLWKTIHHIEDPNLAAYLAFVCTSLYQRVTQLSEFRFWGGSGNTARFNVPFIANEANVFVSFARKARSIQDHLETTASYYKGQAIVVQHSATALDYLPDDSINCIFTDPPFGANINYSEMNILWESWLRTYTDTSHEAIINKVQQKGVPDYQRLMTESLRECHRVLRPGHWMLLVFMNTSGKVWESLRRAITDAGFQIVKADVFDKQHGTFKQFVSDNTAGADIVLHCLKSDEILPSGALSSPDNVYTSILRFLEDTNIAERRRSFLHVKRAEELDVQSLYSEWMAQALPHNAQILDLSAFRTIVETWVRQSFASEASEQ